MTTISNSVLDYAFYIEKRIRLQEGETPNPRRIQHLLYLVLREGFAIIHQPVFETKFTAEPDGPACKDLNTVGNKKSLFTIPRCHISSLGSMIVNSVMEQYGKLDDEEIQSVVQNDTCWKEARERATSTNNPIIPVEQIELESRKIPLLFSLWRMDHSSFRQEQIEEMELPRQNGLMAA